jgi:hypothetical protein
MKKDSMVKSTMVEASSIEARALQLATCGFCLLFFYSINVFELIAGGAQPTLYVQIYVLEDMERQRIWQGRMLRFSDDSPTRRTASTKSLSIARAGHQVGDEWAYELGTKSTRI